jgi:hypothetical protein
VICSVARSLPKATVGSNRQDRKGVGPAWLYAGAGFPMPFAQVSPTGKIEVSKKEDRLIGAKMTENVEELADCDRLPTLRESGRRTSAIVSRPPEIALEASQQEIALSPAARHTKPSPPSSPDCDILIGTKAIGHWLGLTYEQVRPLIDDKTIPTFKLPGHTKRCALKSTLNETFRQHANRRPAASAGAAEKSVVTA